jgi:hypothetical protein
VTTAAAAAAAAALGTVESATVQLCDRLRVCHPAARQQHPNTRQRTLAMLGPSTSTSLLAVLLYTSLNVAVAAHLTVLRLLLLQLLSTRGRLHAAAAAADDSGPGQRAACCCCCCRRPLLLLQPLLGLASRMLAVCRRAACGADRRRASRALGDSHSCALQAARQHPQHFCELAGDRKTACGEKGSSGALVTCRSWRPLLTSAVGTTMLLRVNAVRGRPWRWQLRGCVWVQQGVDRRWPFCARRGRLDACGLVGEGRVRVCS